MPLTHYAREITVESQLLDEEYNALLGENDELKKTEFRLTDSFGELVYKKTTFYREDGTFHVTEFLEAATWKEPSPEQIQEFCTVWKKNKSEALPRNPDAVAILMKDAFKRLVLEKRPDFDAIGEPVTDPGMLSMIIGDCQPTDSGRSGTFIRLLSELTGQRFKVLSNTCFGSVYQPSEGRMLHVYSLVTYDWNEFLFLAIEDNAKGLYEILTKRNFNYYFREDLEARTKDGEVNSVTQLILESLEDAWPDSRMEEVFGEILTNP